MQCLNDTLNVLLSSTASTEMYVIRINYVYPNIITIVVSKAQATRLFGVEWAVASKQRRRCNASASLQRSHSIQIQIRQRVVALLQDQRVNVGAR